MLDSRIWAITIGMTRGCPSLLVGGLKTVLKKVVLIELRRRPPSGAVRCKVVSKEIGNNLHKIQDCQRRKEGVANASGSIRKLISVSFLVSGTWKPNNLAQGPTQNAVLSCTQGAVISSGHQDQLYCHCCTH
jgi:hypothetical protein